MKKQNRPSFDRPPADVLPPYWIVAPMLWLLVLGSVVVVSSARGNFFWGSILGLAVASGAVVTLAVTYRINQWF